MPILRIFKSAINWAWDWIIEHWAAVLSVSGGGLMGYLAAGANWLQQYGPVAWGGVGLLTALIISFVIIIIARAKQMRINAARDAAILAKGSIINPLDKIFEKKRIFINDFILPSHPMIDGKIFTDCEIIGPANIYFLPTNVANPIRPPAMDAVWVSPNARPTNGFILHNCYFNNCSFQLITIYASIDNYHAWKNNPNVNWISIPPTDEQVASLIASRLPKPAPEIKNVIEPKNN